MIDRSIDYKTKLLVASAAMASLLFVGETASALAASQQKGAAANPNAPMITQLKAFRTVLQNANHDYDGHRAKAVHEITKAIHALEGTAVPKAQKGAAKNKGQKGGNNEPQSVSDAQLQQVVTGLHTMQMQMGSNLTGTAAEVNTLISTAIKELETALSIK